MRQRTAVIVDACLAGAETLAALAAGWQPARGPSDGSVGGGPHTRRGRLTIR
jgi:hypothetical protein